MTLVRGLLLSASPHIPVAVQVLAAWAAAAAVPETICGPGVAVAVVHEAQAAGFQPL